MSPKPIAIRGALILCAGFLILFMGGGTRFAVGLTLVPMVDELGWDRSDLGAAVAVFQLVSAATLFAAGRLTDRSGPRFVLGGGLILSGLGMSLMSIIAAPWHAILFYGVVYGLGNGAASLIPVGVMVTRVFPARMGIGNAVVMAGMSVGQLVMIAALASVLIVTSWRSVYLSLGLAHLALLPFLIAVIPKRTAAQQSAPLGGGLRVLAAASTRRFWLLITVYAVCGFDDFFVTTHVVAFAQDRGVDAFLAGNLLALMGLAGLIGVVAGGALSDRSGPVWPTALSFVARIFVFGLLMVDQSVISVVIFALVFGATFLVTAPLVVVFVSENFGRRHLGALTGLITMVHHICGGIGAYFGAAVFDVTRSYDGAFLAALVLSVLALVLSMLLARPRAAALRSA